MSWRQGSSELIATVTRCQCLWHACAHANPQDGARWAPQLVDYTDISVYNTQGVMDHLPHARPFCYLPYPVGGPFGFWSFCVVVACANAFREPRLPRVRTTLSYSCLSGIGLLWGDPPSLTFSPWDLGLYLLGFISLARANGADSVNSGFLRVHTRIALNPLNVFIEHDLLTATTKCL